VHTIQRVLRGRPIEWNDDGGEPVTPGALRSLFHMLHLLLVGIRRSHLTRMAAALSYRTMFGLIPVIAVVALALAAFVSQERQQEVIKGMLTYAGLDKIKVESETNGAPRSPDGSQAAPESPAASGTTPTPQSGDSAEASSSLDKWINDKAVLIASKIKRLPFNLIGFAAILMLIYAAMSMLVEIEQAFNEIYNAPEGRSWVRRIVQYWTLLTLGPVLLIASFTISHTLSDSAESIARLGGDTYSVHLREVLRFAGATCVSTVLLVVIYCTVPNTRVHVMPATLGAAVAAVLWESGKAAFTSYVGFATRPGDSTNYGNLYGAVAILPLFLVWVYLSWLIVLFGLQLAYSMQTYRQATARGLTLSVLSTLGLIEDQHPAGRPRLVDPSAILVVLAAVGSRFRQGHPSDHSHIAQATGVDERAVGEMLEKLTQSGLLLRVVGGPERLATYTLARPPEGIDALEVLRLGDELAGARPGHDRPTPIHDLVGRARAGALSGKTLADLMEGDTPQPGAAAAAGEAPTPSLSGAIPATGSGA